MSTDLRRLHELATGRCLSDEDRDVLLRVSSRLQEAENTLRNVAGILVGDSAPFTPEDVVRWAREAVERRIETLSAKEREGFARAIMDLVRTADGDQVADSAVYEVMMWIDRCQGKACRPRGRS